MRIPAIHPVSDDAVLIVMGENVDPALTPRLALLCETIREALAGIVVDVVPSYTSITVYYNFLKVDFRRIIKELQRLIQGFNEPASSANGRVIELPVWYHPDAGPDLNELAEACNLTVDEVIRRHTAIKYQVYAIGFSPGFGFMGQVDPAIARPRRDSPRVRVPGGSVGIADRQTAVYPSESPGGWQLIGRCPLPLFSETELSRLAVGDQVRFHAINRSRFLELGGDRLEAGERA